jgi:hypothetical protein
MEMESSVGNSTIDMVLLKAESNDEFIKTM